MFAIRDIPKNIKIFKSTPNYKWYNFKVSDFKNLDKELLKMIDDFFVIEKDNSVHIPEYGFNGMDMSFYVNHSNKPNLKTVDNGYTFVSLKKIHKGEELTVCYGNYDYKYKTKN